MNPLMPALNPSGLENDGVAKASSSKTSPVDENKPSFKEAMDKQPRSRADRADNDRDARAKDNKTEQAKPKTSERSANGGEQTQDGAKQAVKKEGGDAGTKSVAGEPSTDAGTSASTSGQSSHSNENMALVGDESVLDGVSLLGVEFDTGDVTDTEALNHTALTSVSEVPLRPNTLALDTTLVNGGVLDTASHSSLETLAPLQAFKALREQVGTLAQAAVLTSGESALGLDGKSLGLAGMTASTVISNAASTPADKIPLLSSAGNNAGALTDLALKDSLNANAKLGQPLKDGSEQVATPLLKASGDNMLTTSNMPFTSTLLKGGNLESALNPEMLTRLGDQLDVGAKPVSGAQPLHASISPSIMSGIPVGADVRVQMPVSIAFGESGWGNMIAERSALMASQSLKFAELQLDPPELGQLQVKVTVNQDQASVSFVAANAQVKEALDQSLVRLKELLEEQGLDLVNVDVSDQSSEEAESDSEGEDDGLLATETGDDEDDTLSPASQMTATYGVDHYA